MEEFLTPFKEWLNSYGITLRAQISYGKNLEISEPISAVDYPEAENRNQNNQVDMYRLWSGGAHLQNKVLSSETGGLDNSGYSYTYQKASAGGILAVCRRLQQNDMAYLVVRLWSRCIVVGL